MKELEKEIERANERLQANIIEYQECDPTDKKRLENLWQMTKKWERYINGLEFAKKCFEKENK